MSAEDELRNLILVHAFALESAKVESRRVAAERALFAAVRALKASLAEAATPDRDRAQ